MLTERWNSTNEIKVFVYYYPKPSMCHYDSRNSVKIYTFIILIPSSFRDQREYYENIGRRHNSYSVFSLATTDKVNILCTLFLA